MSAQNKNSNWLGWRVFDVLSPQTDKIRAVVYNQWLIQGGWEGWAQFELAYGLSRYMDALSQAKNVGGDEFLYDLFREHSYPGTDQRFDFHLSCTLTPNSTRPDPRSHREFHYVELKCQGGWEPMDGFVDRVNEDIQKINECQKRRLQGRGGTNQSIWMIAITASQHGREDGLMHDLGMKWKLTWQVIPLPGLEHSKIWAAHIQMEGNTEDSLFAYST